MFVFVCTGCGAELTAPLAPVALPVHAHQKYGNGIQLPVLMEPGTFAVEPEPWGPPWRRWQEIRPEEAAERGVYGPVEVLSDGTPGAVVIAPGDVRGTVLLPDARGGGYCCGLDGADGPNMACEACGLAVASRVDDCSLWQAVWLDPDAVRRRAVDGAGAGTDAAPLSWAELMEAREGKRTPPFEPITTWAARPGQRRWWAWSPQWEAAAGRALAHMLAASEGRAVRVPEGGLTAQVFQRALDALLPAGPPVRRVLLAGPGLPARDAVPGADAGILLVPDHPQTGEIWTPAGGVGATHSVPLPFGVWLGLAFPETHLPVPASGVMPGGVLRDDPPAPRPRYPFRADPGTFRHTLARLPAARSPWLREILGNITPYMQAGLF
ncbi:hypothetical protein [Streptomyces paludis]|uniref:Uncharacterized protein n=1 Tax=Streptomyces paludis TaxID=2282738 RepID=A0A345HRX0_9ACTN|nr:hypothetical protein [Streptomyces paludis]AXG79444.1 hypothetical protein DVK44_19300 [Streptomyces paludis]